MTRMPQEINPIAARPLQLAFLPGHQPAEQGDQRRRDPAGDGVDLAEIAHAVGQAQGRAVGDVDADRGQEPGPGRGHRRGHEKQERQADRRAGQVDHGQAQERVAAMLDQGVPGRVQHRGAEDDAEDEGVKRPPELLAMVTEPSSAPLP